MLHAIRTPSLRPARGPLAELGGTLNAKVIVSANNNSINTLNKAATRVKNPESSAKPNKTSADVAGHANAGISAVGANQFSFRVLATKWEKSPHATLGCP